MVGKVAKFILHFLEGFPALPKRTIHVFQWRELKSITEFFYLQFVVDEVVKDFS